MMVILRTSKKWGGGGGWSFQPDNVKGIYIYLLLHIRIIYIPICPTEPQVLVKICLSCYIQSNIISNNYNTLVRSGQVSQGFKVLFVNKKLSAGDM